MNDKLVPNSAQIPNVLLDFVLPQLTEAEKSCLLYIARRTYGFHKDFDRISLSQFTDGLTSKEGKRLDCGTGMAKQSVVTALASLKERGLVKVNTNQTGSTYEIDLEASLDWVDSLNVRLPLDQSNDKTTNSLTARPPIVQRLDTQKKEKKGGEKSKEPSALSEKDSKSIVEIIELFEPVNPTYRRLFPIKTERAAVARMLKQFGKEKVVSMVSALPGIISQPFAPRITTPYQLERDMGKLVLFVKQSQRSSNKAVRIS